MYFFEGNVSSASYIKMLQEVEFPELKDKPVYNVQSGNKMGPHQKVGILIRKLFCMKWNEWISCHHGRIKWLPRLNPMWFFTVDIMKEILYSSKPQNLQMHFTSSMKINLCCWKFVIWFNPCVEYMDNWGGQCQL